MEYKSTRTEKFRAWYNTETGLDPTVPAFEFITDLERTARLLVHAFDLTGEVRPEDIHALSRVVKHLQATYERSE